MSPLLHSFLLVFVAIFVALDPVGIIPIYLGLTESMSSFERAKVVNASISVALTVAVVFLFLGNSIFHFLGISLPDFRIAGGLVLLLVSLSDLLRGPESTHRPSGSTGIVPLAVPLITGPGVITTIVLQVPLAGYAITTLALLINFAFAWLLLKYAQNVTRWIGKDGTVVISKIAALLLSAISVTMIRGGIQDLFEKTPLAQ